MKDIVKIVHLPSVVQSECYELTRILFLWKDKKIVFIQQFVSSASAQRHFGEYPLDINCCCSVSAAPHLHFSDVNDPQKMLQIVKYHRQQKLKKINQGILKAKMLHKNWTWMCFPGFGHRSKVALHTHTISTNTNLLCTCISYPNTQIFRNKSNLRHFPQCNAHTCMHAHIELCRLQI